MTVTEAPAMPFWDSDSVICRYSDDLRRTFFQINPYHISCLYKPTFEEHALNKLRDCELDAEATASGSFPGDQDKPDCHSGDNEVSSGINGAEELQSVSLLEEENAENPNENNLPIDPADLSLSDRFYESMRLPCASDDCSDDLKSWKTCLYCHNQDVDKNAFCSKYEIQGISAKRSSTHSHIANKGHGSRQSSASHNHRPMKAAENVQDLIHRYTHCMEFEVEFPNGSTNYHLPKKKRLPSAVYHAPGTILMAPSPQGPIEYPFHHGRPHSYYTDVYRECYTDKHVRCTANAFKATMSTRKSQFLPKARIHCSDVRHGAYLKTTPLPCPSDVKPSKMCFKMAARLGNGSPTWSREPSSSGSRTPSPCILPGTRLSDHQNISDKNIDGRCKSGQSPTGSIQIAETPANQQMSAPIVSRSRPTIPSNANGVICATAVETPGHVVSVKGHSLWNRQHTVLHFLSANSKLHDQNRPHTTSR